MSAGRDLLAMPALLFPPSLLNKDENSHPSAAPLPPLDRRAQQLALKPTLNLGKSKFCRNYCSYALQHNTSARALPSGGFFRLRPSSLSNVTKAASALFTTLTFSLSMTTQELPSWSSYYPVCHSFFYTNPTPQAFLAPARLHICIHTGFSGCTAVENLESWGIIHHCNTSAMSPGQTISPHTQALTLGEKKVPT